MLAVAGGLVAAGIALSFYGSAVVVEDLAQDARRIGGGDGMEVAVDLDRGGQGVYVVQVIEGADGAEISASVAGPSGRVLASHEGGEDAPAEEHFNAEEGGRYVLTVRNSGEEADVAGAVGLVPDAAKFSVGVTGFYLVLAGMACMAVIGVTAIFARRRERAG